MQDVSQEFEAIGVPFEKRGALTDDYLQAIKACWTQDIASYEGRFVKFRDIHTAPKNPCSRREASASNSASPPGAGR